MSNQSPTDPPNNATVKEIDLGAEVRKMWGVNWNKPTIAYRFGEREFELRTEDAAIYKP